MIKPSKLIVRPIDSAVYVGTLPRLESEVHSLLNKLKRDKTRQALVEFSSSLETTLANAIIRVSSSGYTIGAQQVGYAIDTAIGVRLRRDNIARAQKATSWITNTSANSLGINISSAMAVKQIASKARAEKIAGNELRLAYFRGINKGWKLNPAARKEWWVSSAHDNDDTCDDNMDEGPIMPDEAFQSGDFEPPAHINCLCNLALVFVSNKAVNRFRKTL